MIVELDSHTGWRRYDFPEADNLMHAAYLGVLEEHPDLGPHEYRFQDPGAEYGYALYLEIIRVEDAVRPSITPAWVDESRYKAGGVWFSQLNEHKIGRIDPDTLEYEMVETPFETPRRLRFDSRGGLWIPSFSQSLLSHFDPATRTFRTWPIPIEPLGTETPYALAVQPETDDSTGQAGGSLD